jgi:hypothetical protein
MIQLPTRFNVFATLTPTDMRKSFSGLIGIVEKELGQQIETGDLFLFFNRTRNRLKVLFFTGDGTVILYKRLERGTFEMLREPIAADSSKPSQSSSNYLTLRANELQLLLEGIELSSVRRRRWWRRDISANLSATTTTCIDKPK